MTDFPYRGQKAPDYWDEQLKAYIDARSGVVSVNGEPGAVTVEPTVTAGSIDQYYRGDKTWADLAAKVTNFIQTNGSGPADAVDDRIDAKIPALPFTTPEIYGAVGDGVADDKAVIQTAIDALHAAGGGTVVLSKRYGGKGTLIVRGGVVLKGTAVRRYLITDDGLDRGLVALDNTFKVQIGAWATANSADDNPGGLDTLGVDGANTGAANLVEMQGVGIAITDCRIVRAGGNALQVGGSQNSTITRCDIGYSAGSAVDVMVSGQQGAGNVKFQDCYIGTSRYLLTGNSDPTQVWPHDMMFDNCLFENYTAGNDLVYLKAGDWRFEKCLFTNSNSGSPQMPNNCLVLITQETTPTIVTTVGFDGCYFAGGTAKAQHAVRTVTVTGTGVGNVVRFGGAQSQFQNCNYVLGLDGGGAFSPSISFVGEAYRDPSMAWFELLNGAWMHNVKNRYGLPAEWRIPDDATSTMTDPIDVARVSDTVSKFRLSRDGVQRWFDGSTIASVRGSLQWDSATALMKAGGTWRFENGVGIRYTVFNVSTVAQGVALSGAVTASPGYEIAFTATNATASVTISGGVQAGQQIKVALIAFDSTNSVTWPVNIRFTGSTPQPIVGQIVCFDLFLHTDGNWYQTSQSPVVNQIQENRVVGAQETMPRETVDQNNLATVSGLLELTYFTAYRTETINSIRTYSGGTAAGATPTTCLVGLYTVAANGDLTRVATTANTTTLWAATNTAYTTALTAGYGLIAGVRYALARLCVTAAAAPAWPCQSTAISLSGEAPRLNGQVSGQSALPSTISNGSIANGSVRRYAELVP